MSKTIRLIWDFKGPNAEPTATHHCIHLKEFAINNNLTLQTSEVEMVNEFHYVAFLEVTEHEMAMVRDALKPHRGEIVA